MNAACRLACFPARAVPNPGNQRRNRHHPLPACLANPPCRFSINAKWIHDLSVAYGASLNAFTAGRGLDLNVDHHRAGPWANLFTNINVGCGSRPFFSSGRQGKGAHAGGQGAALPGGWQPPPAAATAAAADQLARAPPDDGRVLRVGCQHVAAARRHGSWLSVQAWGR